MRPFRLGALVLVATLLTGCVGELGVSNFELEPERAGWNVGEEATFTLRLTPTFTVREPSYALDPEIAVEEVRLNEKGVGFGGDVSTRTPSDLGFMLLRNGSAVDEHDLTLNTPEVDLRLDLPEDLEDSTYVLEVKLFRVGWVTSDTFRVNRP